MTFRTASPSDVASIVAIADLPHARGSLHVPSADALTADLDAPGKHAFVVERDGAVVGFVRLVNIDGWLVEVASLAAREPGAGIGWFALRETLRFAFDTLRAHRTYAEVVATNARARRLYEGFGFRLEGTWRDGYRDEDGTFADLCAYGLLEQEHRAASASRESPRSR